MAVNSRAKPQPGAPETPGSISHPVGEADPPITRLSCTPHCEETVTWSSWSKFHSSRILEDKLLEWPGPRPQGSWESPSQAPGEGGFQGCSVGVSRSGWTLLLSPGSRAARPSRLGEDSGCVYQKAAGSRLGSDSAVVLAGPAFPPGAAGQPRPALHGASGEPLGGFSLPPQRTPSCHVCVPCDTCDFGAGLGLVKLCVSAHTADTSVSAYLVKWA